MSRSKPLLLSAFLSKETIVNTIAIENAVQEFREQQIQAMHRRLNATAPRDQTSAFVASEMRGVDRLVASHRESLGEPDDPPAEPSDGGNAD